MSNPSDTRAWRTSATLTFTDVTTAETARKEVQLQGAVTVPQGLLLAGYRLMRTGGDDAAVVTTVRYWDASTGGENVFQQDHTISVNNDSSLVDGVAVPLNTSTFSQLNVSLQNDTGSTQDYTLVVFFRPLVS